MTEERTFPTIDTTKWVLRTKSAPLSESGCHEIVMSARAKSELKMLARLVFGRQWTKDYEVVAR